MNVAICSRPLNLISICTGGGGLDLGVELAIPDARTVCMVEREGFAVATLASAMEAGLMAPAPIWSDARTFDGRAWRGAVDGLIGGIPCQPHSLAGKKRGSLDGRDLWSTARRIIVQSKAWFVVIENVGGMLAAGADEIAGAQRVFRDLSKLGFEVEGGLFTAAEVGASHQRERIIILAVADRDSQHGDWGGIRGARRRGQPTDGGGEVPGVGQADAYSERLEGVGADAGAQGRPDARRSSGLCDGTALVNALGCGHDWRSDDPVWRTVKRITSEGAGITVERAVGNASCLIGADVIDRSGTTGQRFVTLDRAAGRNGHGRGAEGDLSRQREDATSSWLRPVFPPGPDDRDGWREVLARSPELEPAFRRMADGVAPKLDTGRVDRLRMLGNGVVPLQAAHAIRSLALTLARRGSASAIELIRMMEIAA